MVDQRFDALDEAHGVRQRGVNLKGFLADPARVYIKKHRIADGAESMDADTARFLTGRAENIGDRIRQSRFIPWARVKAPEDV